MKKYIFIYSGKAMDMSDPAVMKAQFEEWDMWYKKLGKNLIDGGFPFMPDAKMTDGKRSETSNASLTGFTVIKADSYEQALKWAMECPVAMGGEMVHVCEELPMKPM